MAIPAPEADENTVAPYGIRYPKPGSKAFKLATRFQRIAEDVTAALQAFGLPPVITGTPVVALSAAARDAHWGTPASAAARRALQDLGAIAVRPDLGWTEQYFAGLTDGGANPGGAITAGWYPIMGAMPFGSLRRSAAAWTVPNNAATLATDLITDVAAGVTVGSGLGTLTITQPGIYEISAALCYNNPAASTGVVQLYGTKNSAVFSVNPILFASQAANTATQGTPYATKKLPLVAGDVLRLFAYQNTGAGISMPDNTNSQGQATTFAARYLGPSRA